MHLMIETNDYLDDYPYDNITAVAIKIAEDFSGFLAEQVEWINDFCNICSF